jgi:uncharacterized protein
MKNALTNDRLDVVDALRGFALLGITFVHFAEQFYAMSPPQDHGNYSQHIPADGIVQGVLDFLLRGKFFMLFSFLFGLSFAIQMGNAQSKGINFSGRFLWRLVILFAIGVVHQLFYNGDILTVYALLGLPLIPFINIPNKWLLFVFALLMFGLPRLIILNTKPPINYEEQAKLDEPKNKIYWNAAKHGTFKDIAYQNIIQGAVSKWDGQFGFFGRGYQTFALFILGLYAGRNRFFDNIAEKIPRLKKGIWWSVGILVGIIGMGALLFLLLKLPQKFGQIGEMFFGLMLYDWGNFVQAGIYVFGFLLLFAKKAWWKRQILKLAPYGRMALTNYVVQSIIGTTLLFGFGFGQLGNYGTTVMFATALIVYIGQLHFSRWWLQHYHFGILEWLWRSITYFKWQPFKKTTDAQPQIS